MINLSLERLRVIAKSRNISNYENKSKEDLTKALSEPKSETSKQTPKQILKPEAKPKLKPKTKPKSKPETKLRKDFDELRNKFSNKDEIREYRQAFYDAKKTNFPNQK